MKKLFLLPLLIGSLINAREFTADEIKLLRQNFEHAKRVNIKRIIKYCSERDFVENHRCRAALIFVSETEEQFLQDSFAREHFFELLKLAKNNNRIEAFVQSRTEDNQENALDDFDTIILNNSYWLQYGLEKELKIKKNVSEYANILFQSQEFIDKEFKQ